MIGASLQLVPVAFQVMILVGLAGWVFTFSPASLLLTDLDERLSGLSRARAIALAAAVYLVVMVGTLVV
jgi:hypothetical protein